MLRLFLSYDLGRLDYNDPEDKGILHMAAIMGDLETIETLADAKLSGIPTDLRDIHGNTPMESFVNVRQNYQSEDEVEREACFAAFKRLLESIVPEMGDEAYVENQVKYMDLDQPSNHFESDGEEFF